LIPLAPLDKGGYKESLLFSTDRFGSQAPDHFQLQRIGIHNRLRGFLGAIRGMTFKAQSDGITEYRLQTQIETA
jgi:hypothetical protein